LVDSKEVVSLSGLPSLVSVASALRLEKLLTALVTAPEQFVHVMPTIATVTLNPSTPVSVAGG